MRTVTIVCLFLSVQPMLTSAATPPEVRSQKQVHLNKTEASLLPLDRVRTCKTRSPTPIVIRFASCAKPM
jgi:hypothetical protein